ncbi:hypothetical protein BJ741DRAFT_584308 [Chytriomyces cf. hyalinus JEL632]|nr:hypothetical protein BJ741DRAFT_584308 [Chytriomyces cf. hyalinus JEL632]
MASVKKDSKLLTIPRAPVNPPCRSMRGGYTSPESVGRLTDPMWSFGGLSRRLSRRSKYDLPDVKSLYASAVQQELKSEDNEKVAQEYTLKSRQAAGPNQESSFMFKTCKDLPIDKCYMAGESCDYYNTGCRDRPNNFFVEDKNGVVHSLYATRTSAQGRSNKMYKEPDVIASIPRPTKEAIVYEAYEKGQINDIVANIQREHHHVQLAPTAAAAPAAAATPAAAADESQVGGRRRSSKGRKRRSSNAKRALHSSPKWKVKRTRARRSRSPSRRRR